MASTNVRVGLFLQPIHPPEHHPGVTLHDDLNLMVELDRLGFHEAWIGEHHSTGWETLPSPAAFIAAAAERTRSLRLGSGVVALPQHHPLVVAGTYSQLDHQTRGRVMLGVGPGGGLPSDPLTFGLSPERLRDRFIERFDVLMRLWGSEEPVTIQGDGFEMHEALLQVKPHTQPHPEMAIVCGMNEPSLTRIGQHGLRWLVGVGPERFDEAWQIAQAGAEHAGRTADRQQATIPVTAFVADSEEQAQDQIAAGALRERFEFALGVNAKPGNGMGEDAWLSHLIAQPTSLIGSPNMVADKLAALLEATGAGGVMVTHKTWAGPTATLESYGRLMREVVPKVTGHTARLQQAAHAASRLNQNPSV